MRKNGKQTSCREDLNDGDFPPNSAFLATRHPPMATPSIARVQPHAPAPALTITPFPIPWIPEILFNPPLPMQSMKTLLKSSSPFHIPPTNHQKTSPSSGNISPFHGFLIFFSYVSFSTLLSLLLLLLLVIVFILSPLFSVVDFVFLLFINFKLLTKLWDFF